MPDDKRLNLPCNPEATASMVKRLKNLGASYGDISTKVVPEMRREITNRIEGIDKVAPDLYPRFYDAAAAKNTEQFYVTWWSDYLHHSLKMTDDEKQILGRYLNEKQIEAEEKSSKDQSGMPRLTPTEIGMAESNPKVQAALRFLREEIEPFSEQMILANGLRPEQLSRERKGVYIKVSRKGEEPFPEGDPRNEASKDPDSPYYIGARARSLQERLYIGKAKATRKFGEHLEPVELVDDPIEMMRLTLHDRTITGMMRSLLDSIKASENSISEGDAIRIATRIKNAKPANPATLDALARAMARAALTDSQAEAVSTFARDNLGTEKPIRIVAEQIARSTLGDIGAVDVAIPWLDEDAKGAAIKMSIAEGMLAKAERTADESLIDEAKDHLASTVQKELNKALASLMTGSTKYYVPKRVAEEWNFLQRYYSGEFWDADKWARGFKKITGTAISLRLLTGAELLGHTARMLWQATARSMGGEHSAVRNAFLFMGAAPIDTGIRSLRILDTPEGQRMLKLLGTHGGVNIHTFSEYTSALDAAEKQIADAQGVADHLKNFGLNSAEKLQKGVEGARKLVFGLRGMDTRLRVFTGLKFEEFFERINHRKPSPIETAEFVNRTFGNYVAPLMGRLARRIRELRLFVFLPSQAAMITDEIGEMFGNYPREFKEAPLYDRLLMRLQTAHARWIAYLVGFGVLNLALSGHYPWDNQQGHRLDLEIGHGKKKAHLPIKYFSPFYRPARMMGISDAGTLAFDTLESGGPYGELAANIGENALRQGANYIFQNTAGSPPYEPLLIGAMGWLPWISPSGEVLRAVPTTESGEGELKDRTLAAAGSLLPAVNNLWPLWPSYADTWGSRLTYWALKTFVGSGFEPEHNDLPGIQQSPTYAPYVYTVAKDVAKHMMQSVPIDHREEYLRRQQASIPQVDRVAFDAAVGKTLLSQYVGKMYEVEGADGNLPQFREAERILGRYQRRINRISGQVDKIRNDAKLGLLDKRRQIQPLQEEAFSLMSQGVLQSMIPITQHDPNLSDERKTKIIENLRRQLQELMTPANPMTNIPPSAPALEPRVIF